MQYTTGENAIPDSGLPALSAAQIGAGSYYFQYHAPPAAFAFIPDSFINGLINGWVSIKNFAAGEGDSTMAVRGVSVDTDTGDVWIFADVSIVPVNQNNLINGQPVTVMQAGVPVWGIIAIVAGILAALGIALVLIKVVGGTAVAVATGFALGIAFVVGVILLLVWVEVKRGGGG